MVKLSIITPVYNGVKFIEDNVLNVQAQSYKNIEHIIIDGGSTDGTLKILEKYKNVITYISEKDKGQSDAINKGFKLSSGDVVTWLGVDDYYENPNVLEAVAKYFEDQNIKVLEGTSKIIYLQTGKERMVSQPEISERNLIRWWNEGSIPPQPSIFFRRELIEKYGDLDINLHYCMDHDLWLRFLVNGEKFTLVKDLFSIILIHPESKTGSATNNFIKEHDKVAKRYWGKLYQPKFWRRLLEYIYARYYKFKHVFRSI